MQINVSRVATLSGVTVMSKFLNDAKILMHNMRTFVELLHVARFFRRTIFPVSARILARANFETKCFQVTATGFKPITT